MSTKKIYRPFSYLELECNRVSAKVCVELCANVDGGRLPRRVLHHQEQLGHDLDHVTSLQTELSKVIL